MSCADFTYKKVVSDRAAISYEVFGKQFGNRWKKEFRHVCLVVLFVFLIAVRAGVEMIPALFLLLAENNLRHHAKTC